MSPEGTDLLAIIPARGGSKGLPRKNIRLLGGKPLICWTIEAALKAKCVGRVIVSTDDPEISDISTKCGAEVPFLRPAELSTDTASSEQVVAHTMDQCPGYDVIALLQPTSPFRTSLDIDKAFSLFTASGAAGCVSITRVDKSPWHMFQAASDGRLNRILPPFSDGMRRQDLPPVYTLNGAIYFVRAAAFQEIRSLVPDDCVGYEMPEERSLDIDDIQEFETAEKLINS